jgi:hypothetical protein
MYQMSLGVKEGLQTEEKLKKHVAHMTVKRKGKLHTCVIYAENLYAWST